MNQRGARSRRQPARPVRDVDERVQDERRATSSEERLARIAMQDEPASTTKATPSVDVEVRERHAGLAATARPIGTPPMAASSSAAHCASRSSPISRSGCAASMRRDSPREHADAPTPDSTAAVEQHAGRVGHGFPLYLARACARSTSFARSATAARSTPTRFARSSPASTDGSWPDYQVSALLMAIVWRGMSLDEAVDADRRDGAIGRAARPLASSAARRSTSIRPAASATRRRSSSRRSPPRAAPSCR